MKCDTCHAQIPQGEQREHYGKLLCEDCYMIALSPVKTCDPWAVHSAKSMDASTTDLTPTQKKIISILKETGGIEPGLLAERMGMSLEELQREFAPLRHMEKTRAVQAGDKKLFKLW